MAIVALALAVVALFVALRAATQQPAAPAPDDASRHLEARLERIERWLKQLAERQPVTAEMIDEGRLYPEIDAAEARRWVESERRPGLSVLDVRTESEVRGGHVPGAKWIPLDQIEERAREVPRSGTVLVVCAVGARSAAACEFLTAHGHANVVNVAGGMSAWKGAVTTGMPG